MLFFLFFSRKGLTFADNYIIMANMTNNKQVMKSVSLWLMYCRRLCVVVSGRRTLLLGSITYAMRWIACVGTTMVILPLGFDSNKFWKNIEIPLDKLDSLCYNATMTNNDNKCFFERIKMNFSDLCFACVFGVLSAWLWVAIVTL